MTCRSFLKVGAVAVSVALTLGGSAFAWTPTHHVKTPRGQILLRQLPEQGILFAFALVDLVVYALLKLVTVCYRCQAEFRGAYRRTASGFDLHQAERLELEYGRSRETGRGVRSAGSPPR